MYVSLFIKTRTFLIKILVKILKFTFFLLLVINNVMPSLEHFRKITYCRNLYIYPRQPVLINPIFFLYEALLLIVYISLTCY